MAVAVELPGDPPVVTARLARLLLQVIREDAERQVEEPRAAA